MNPKAASAKPDARDSGSVHGMIRAQRDLYRDLQHLAGRQRRLIAADDPGALLAVLSQRQQITRSLVELGDRLAPYREDWPAACQALPPVERREVREMLDEVSDLLGRIIASDEDDARLLTARKTQIAATLGSFQGSRQAVGAYASTARTSAAAVSRFDRIDEES